MSSNGDHSLGDLFEQLFAGELPASRVKELREAVRLRLEGLRRARETGQLPPTAEAELAELEQVLAVLDDEVVIAEFVESSLTVQLLDDNEPDGSLDHGLFDDTGPRPDPTDPEPDQGD